MDSLRKWFYRPKKDDKSLLAQFFFADEALNMIASELDSFDGRKDPERCTALVNQLRQSQDKVLTITNAIMDVLIGDERANRDFRVKFPEDVLQENLAGQLWFGAECLAAGSSIMNREAESTAMRPLAKALTKSLEHVRNLLRDACLRNNTLSTLKNNELIMDMLLESLKIFDRLFAEFELHYVSAMVPVKTTQEYELQEMIGVLFSETLQRALKMHLLSQDMVDDCDPALMFTIPRLAIVSGLLIYPNGPLCIDKPIDEMSEMFRPFRTLLHKIRDLLWTLNKRELYMLEKLLCDNEQSSDIKSVSSLEVNSDLDAFVNHFYSEYPLYKDYVSNFCKKDQCIETNPNTKSKRSPKRRSNSSEGDMPSTSGYYVLRAEMRPDQQAARSDSLELISEAAATLSSILMRKDSQTEQKPAANLDSPNDSGISTENTSLDRSPSIDLVDLKNCTCKQNSSKASINENNTNNNQNGQSKNTAVAECKRKCVKPYNPSIDDDTSSIDSSDTSSFNSISADDEEIALALQAAEMASRNEIRSKFRSSEDLIHRLYVCIAGVADQLQTNFASDLRNILKYVFLVNTSDANPVPEKTPEVSLENSIEYRPSQSEIIENNEFSVDPNILAQEALFDSNVYFHVGENGEESSGTSVYSNHPRPNNEEENLRQNMNCCTISEEQRNSVSARQTVEHHVRNESCCEQPPIWIPDIEAPKCMSCKANFTVVKRRHHCRNCGKVFCARCSSNSVPLPKFGHIKPVRVCNKCFLYHLSPFTM